MTVSLIAFSFKQGGAALAALKFKTILGPLESSSISQSRAGLGQLVKRGLSYGLVKLQIDHNPIKHSLNLFSYSPALKFLNQVKQSIVHIHWFNNDTLSVFSLDKIPSGSIITLHDEWLYCGAEHYYKIDDEDLDFINGYHFFKKGVWGLHWNYLIWKVKVSKLRHRTDLIYTVPSQWMLERAQKSFILKESNIRLLPNPIDIDLFKPVSKKGKIDFRKKLNLAEEDIVFSFGAIGGKSSYLKGAHILDEALQLISLSLEPELMRKIKLISFGGREVGSSTLFGFTNISLGHIAEAEKLVELYASSDCVVVPSLVESFGQVAAEALACGTPVICFECSGLTDIVKDKQNGLLAKAYSVEDLAEKIKEIIFMGEPQRNLLGKKGREHIVKSFSFPVIKKQYYKIIDEARELKMGVED